MCKGKLQSVNVFQTGLLLVCINSDLIHFCHILFVIFCTFCKNLSLLLQIWYHLISYLIGGLWFRSSQRYNSIWTRNGNFYASHHITSSLIIQLLVAAVKPVCCRYRSSSWKAEMSRSKRANTERRQVGPKDVFYDLGRSYQTVHSFYTGGGSCVHSLSLSLLIQPSRTCDLWHVVGGPLKLVFGLLASAYSLLQLFNNQIEQILSKKSNGQNIIIISVPSIIHIFELVSVRGAKMFMEKERILVLLRFLRAIFHYEYAHFYAVFVLHGHFLCISIFRTITLAVIHVLSPLWLGRVVCHSPFSCFWGGCALDIQE